MFISSQQQKDVLEGNKVVYLEMNLSALNNPVLIKIMYIKFKTV